MFVTLEGIDRSGKSTQARLLAESLGPDVVSIREPGGTPVGEQVRALLKDPAIAVSPHTEALLFAAARAELVSEVIGPALAEGRTVICDRFLDSSLAYQGAARGLGVERVIEINRFGIGDLAPDLTLLFDLDPADALERGGEVDRFEAEGTALLEDVRDAYLAFARSAPERWHIIDAARDEEAVQGEVIAVIRERQVDA